MFAEGRLRVIWLLNEPALEPVLDLQCQQQHLSSALQINTDSLELHLGSGSFKEMLLNVQSIITTPRERVAVV